MHELKKIELVIGIAAREGGFWSAGQQAGLILFPGVDRPTYTVSGTVGLASA